jgi:hypothetical protein
MCPICITSGLIYSVIGIISLIGFDTIGKSLKKKYHIWSGKKCDKCKTLK